MAHCPSMNKSITAACNGNIQKYEIFSSFFVEIGLIALLLQSRQWRAKPESKHIRRKVWTFSWLCCSWTWSLRRKTMKSRPVLSHFSFIYFLIMKEQKPLRRNRREKKLLVLKPGLSLSWPPGGRSRLQLLMRRRTYDSDLKQGLGAANVCGGRQPASPPPPAAADGSRRSTRRRAVLQLFSMRVLSQMLRSPSSPRSLLILSSLFLTFFFNIPSPLLLPAP